MKINKDGIELLMSIKGIIKNKKLDENLIFYDDNDEEKIFKITDVVQSILDIDTEFTTMATLLSLISINYDKLVNRIKSNKNSQIDSERMFNVVGFCLEWLEVEWGITEKEVSNILDTINNLKR